MQCVFYVMNYILHLSLHEDFLCNVFSTSWTTSYIYLYMRISMQCVFYVMSYILHLSLHEDFLCNVFSTPWTTSYMYFYILWFSIHVKNTSCITSHIYLCTRVFYAMCLLRHILRHILRHTFISIWGFSIQSGSWKTYLCPVSFTVAMV